MNSEKSAFLFIDDTWIDSLENMMKGVVPAEKISQEPLIGKDQPWEAEWLIGSYVNVIYDNEDDVFKMWYGVGKKLSEARGDQSDRLAYAVSKDGRTWHRAGNREPILHCGLKCCYDSGNVYPSHAPFIHNDQIWLYHAGSNELHGEPPRHGEQSRRGINLAKIDRDRLVGLRAKTQGVVTTTPLSINPDKLFINADASGGSLEAEIVDPFDRVLPGYSRENCVPLVANETTHKVKWKNQVEENNRGYMRGLEEKMVSQAPGGLKVKLYMNNAILFAVYET